MKKASMWGWAGVCVAAALAIVVVAISSFCGRTEGRHCATRSGADVAPAKAKAAHTVEDESCDGSPPSRDLDSGDDHAENADGNDAPSDSEAEEDTRTFIPAEEIGEDLSKLGKADLLKRLSESKDRVELRKAARALGDRSISGTLSLSETETVAVSNRVCEYLRQTMTDNADDWNEAKEQIERLWRVAAPALLANIGSSEPAIGETAIKSLVLMRNAEIVSNLMSIARTTTNMDIKVYAVFSLGKMTEKRESLISGRTCMSDEASLRMANTLIHPFLLEMKAAETNAEVRNAVFSALEDLTLAAERRLVPEKQK
jgi:hypothetical protein